MKFLYGIYRIFLYVSYFIGTIFVTVIVLILSVIFGKPTANVVPRLYAKLLCVLIPLRYKVEGRENIQKKQSYVIVLNHRSLMDIVIIYAALNLDVRWVMKKELTKVPFFGHTALILGNIPIDRNNTKKAVESINNAKETIVNGTCVAFFPEGTRVNDMVLGPFKKGAFHFALDVGLPILPVTITGSDSIMPKNSHKFVPGKVIVKILPQLSLLLLPKNQLMNFQIKLMRLWKIL
jgi:1-acyl-sn-glycerol-3-phosphate acyltransferase